MFYVLIASALIVVVSLSTRFVAWLSPERLHRWLPALQAVAAGVLLGDALLHMLPEALVSGVADGAVGTRLALGALGLFAIECLIRAAARPSPGTAPFAKVDIVGDVIHHLTDGIVIGASFALDTRLGFVVTLAVACHELPREMGHVGVLIAGGFNRRQAFWLSVAAALAVPVGAIVFTFIRSPRVLGEALGVTAGAMLYLALSDLIPSIWRSVERLQQRASLAPLAGVVGGVAFMWLMTYVDHVH